MLRVTSFATASLLLALALGTGCDSGDDEPEPTSTETPATISPTATATASPTADAGAGTALGRQVGGGTCEAVLPAVAADAEAFEVGMAVRDVFVCVAEPLPGAGVQAGAMLEVRGYQAGAFEQNVVIELRDDRGEVIVQASATADAPDLGLIVGEWSATLDVPRVANLEGATLAAFATSAKDGSIDFGGEIPLGARP